MQYYQYEGEDIHLTSLDKKSVIHTNSIYTVVPSDKYFLFILQDENNTTIKIDQKIVASLMQNSQEIFINENSLGDLFSMDNQKLKEKELAGLVADYVQSFVYAHYPKGISLTKNYEKISENLNAIISELKLLEDLNNIDELLVKFKKNPAENFDYDKNPLLVKETKPYKYIDELERNAYSWLSRSLEWASSEGFNISMVISSINDSLSLLKVAHNISTGSFAEAAENANLDTIIRDSYSQEFYDWFANYEPPQKPRKKMK